jgi:hypothetical protein
MARRRVTALIDELESATRKEWHYDTTGGGCTALQTRRDKLTGSYWIITHKENECSVNEVKGHPYTHADNDVIVETAGEWLLGTVTENEEGDMIGCPMPLTFRSWGAVVHALTW